MLLQKSMGPGQFSCVVSRRKRRDIVVTQSPSPAWTCSRVFRGAVCVFCGFLHAPEATLFTFLYHTTLGLPCDEHRTYVCTRVHSKRQCEVFCSNRGTSSVAIAHDNCEADKGMYLVLLIVLLMHKGCWYERLFFSCGASCPGWRPREVASDCVLPLHALLFFFFSACVIWFTTIYLLRRTGRIRV